jgi:hypothetical protein
MTTETPASRRPIPAVRISTIALIGIVAAVAVPTGAATLGLTDFIDSQQKQVQLNQAGPVTKVVIEDADSTVRITGDAALSGMTGHADVGWHSFSGNTGANVGQQYADGVLTLTKSCGSTDCTADIDIRVPPTVSVQVTTSNAGVSVIGISGGVVVQDENASISAKQLGAGDVTLNTSNASIDATFIGGPKNIWAHTSNAPVKIITDGRTPHFDKITSNDTVDAQHSEPHTDNTIDVLTTNGPVTIK